MNNFGIFVALSTTLAWTIGQFPFSTAAKRLGPQSANYVRLLTATFILVICSMFFLSFSFFDIFTQISKESLFYFALSGVIGLAIGDSFGFITLGLLGPKWNGILSTLAPGAALFTGYLLIDEQINAIGLIGIFISIAGIMITIFGRSPHNTLALKGDLKSKGLICGVTSALCQGLAIVISKMAFNVSPTPIHPLHATTLRLFFSVLFLFFLHLFRQKNRELIRPALTNQNGGLPYLMVGTFIGSVVGISLSLYALFLVEAAVAQTLFSLMPITTLVAARYVYKERITSSAAIGALVAIVGVFLLVWRNSIV